MKYRTDFRNLTKTRVRTHSREDVPPGRCQSALGPMVIFENELAWLP
jgi:hypothetical protein